MTPLALAIVRVRRQRGWSQARLAVAIGRHRGTVARWESGARSPSVPDLQAIADAVGVWVGVLLGAPLTP